MNEAGVTPLALNQKWQFGLEIDGFLWAYFSKASFPEMEFDEVTFAPAGSMFDQKAAGRAKFSDIEVEKGIPADSFDTSLLDWIEKCISVTAATGGAPSEYMKDIDLVKYNRAGGELVRYRCFGAWVKKAKLGEGEGKSSDNDIETITIAYQYFKKV